MPRQKATNCIQEPPMQACNAQSLRSQRAVEANETSRHRSSLSCSASKKQESTRTYCQTFSQHSSPTPTTHPRFALSCNTCRDDLGVSKDRAYRRGTLEKPCRFLKAARQTNRTRRSVSLDPESDHLLSSRRTNTDQRNQGFMRMRKTVRSPRVRARLAAHR
jgi:hypothetical protein